MPFIDIGSEEIFYTFSKADNSQTFLLIHGSGADHSTWPRNLRRFSEANVYAVDLPGHGRSTGGGRKSVDDYADFIEAFISHLHLNNVTLFGHSLGGAITQCLALRSPGWLARIILVGTGARLRVHPGVLDGFLSDFKAAIDLICDWALSPTAPKSLAEAVGEVFAKTDPEIMHGDFSACDQFDITEKIVNISIPTLVVSGTADKLTPVKYGEYLCNHIPGAKLSIIEDGGHMMALEKPDDFMASITSFLVIV